MTRAGSGCRSLRSASRLTSTRGYLTGFPHSSASNRPDPALPKPPETPRRRFRLDRLHANARIERDRAVGQRGERIAVELANLGRDLHGGSFVYDPWELYGRELTDPNMVLVGHVGSAKSSLVKTLIYRQYVFGRLARVIDVKREYAPLAQALLLIYIFESTRLLCISYAVFCFTKKIIHFCPP